MVNQLRKTCILIFFSVILLLVSCDNQQFLDDTRFIVKGQLLDENNAGIAGAEVQVISDFSTNSNGDDILTGLGKTDANGRFKIASLFDPDTDLVVLIENVPDYSIYRYKTNTIDLKQVDYSIDLNEIVLQPKKDVSIKFVSTDNSNESIVYELNYRLAACFVSSEGGVLETVFENCYDPVDITRVLNPTTGNDTIELTAVANTDVTIIYQIGTNSSTQITEIFNSQNTEYVIEF